MTSKDWAHRCVEAPLREGEERRAAERIAERVVALLQEAGQRSVQPAVSAGVTIVVVPAGDASGHATDLLGRLAKTDFGGIGLQARMSDEATGLGPGNGKGEK